MNISVDRREDGEPLLSLEAENDSDEEALERLNDQLQDALDSARIAGLAGDYNACGSLRGPGMPGRPGRMRAITVSLLLGVHPLDIGHIRDAMRRIEANSAMRQENGG